MTHRHDRQLKVGQPGNVVSVSARRVDEIAALNGATIGLHSADTPLMTVNRFDGRGDGESNAAFAALMLVSFHDTSRCHAAVRRTPEHRFDLAEVHQGPAAF